MICNYEVIKTNISNSNYKSLQNITMQFYESNSIELQKRILLLLLRKVRKNILKKYKVLGEYNFKLIKINLDKLKEGVHELLYTIYKSDDSATGNINVSKWKYIRFEEKEITTQEGFVFLDPANLAFYSPVENYVINLKSIKSIQKNGKIFNMKLNEDKKLTFEVSEENNLFTEKLQEQFGIEEEIEEEIDKKIEDKLEEEIDKKIEDKIEDKIEEEIEDKIDEEIDKKIEDKIEDKIDDKIDEEIEDKIDESLEKYTLCNSIKDFEVCDFVNSIGSDKNTTTTSTKDFSFKRSSLNKNRLVFRSDLDNNFGNGLLIKIKRQKKIIFTESKSPENPFIEEPKDVGEPKFKKPTFVKEIESTKKPISSAEQPSFNCEPMSSANEPTSVNPLKCFSNERYKNLEVLKRSKKKKREKKIKKINSISKNMERFIERLTKVKLGNLKKLVKKEAKKIKQRRKALENIMKIFIKKYITATKKYLLRIY
ncbi:Protein stu1 [Nosema granulosis]|uniref:Protein stu1 n=1 Tax=Nosema granulosis TaxID=83296 RepID=A0A9P6GZR2_9MICR|nr:Protein stu1 [Nosema granulosis]